MFFYGPTDILIIPAILIALYAQYKVKSTFNKYIETRNVRGLTGADVARRILDTNGLHDVKVEMVPGQLSDHYDPKGKVVRLSDDVYAKQSLSALGVAAHETGHAIQDSLGYVPLRIRSGLFPVANIGSAAAFPLILLGFVLGRAGGIFINLGILFFSLAVLFQIVTLPVEFNASKRALAILGDEGLLSNEELKPAKKVLSAAAFTYVAAALVSVMQLIRLLLLSRSDD